MVAVSWAGSPTGRVCGFLLLWGVGGLRPLPTHTPVWALPLAQYHRRFLYEGSECLSICLYPEPLTSNKMFHFLLFLLHGNARIIGFWKSKLPNLTSILPSSFSPAPGHLWESGSGEFPSPLSSLASLLFRDRVSTISYKRSGPSLSSLTFIAGRLGLVGILGWEMGLADLYGGTYKVSGKVLSN